MYEGCCVSHKVKDVKCLVIIHSSTMPATHETQLLRTAATTHLFQDDVATRTELLFSGWTSKCPYLARAADTRPGDTLTALLWPSTTSHGGRLLVGSRPFSDCKHFLSSLTFIDAFHSHSPPPQAALLQITST